MWLVSLASDVFPPLDAEMGNPADWQGGAGGGWSREEKRLDCVQKH